MALRLNGSFVVLATLLWSVRGSPPLDAKSPFQDSDLDRLPDKDHQDLQKLSITTVQDAIVPKTAGRKNLLQKNDQQTDLRENAPSYLRAWVDPLTIEDAEMLDQIWAKYSQGQGSMNLQQLNLLLQDTDHEFGEQVVTQSWWQSLCKEFNVDPSQGLSKQNLVSLYLKSEGSSIKRDYVRIFVEGAPPAKAGRKNLLQKSDKQLTEDQMFEAIWIKYSQGAEGMTLKQLNSLLQDTDHELGEQVISDAEWQSICEEMGAEVSKRLSKEQFLSLYSNPRWSGSIRRDYIRIFVEGAAPAQSQTALASMMPVAQKQIELAQKEVSEAKASGDARRASLAQQALEMIQSMTNDVLSQEKGQGTEQTISV